MKNRSVNYFQCVAIITLVTGINPVTKDKLKDREGNLRGLLQEDITQGVKVRLNRSLKNVKEQLSFLEKSRIELMEKNGYDAKDKKLSKFDKVAFKKEFAILSAESYEVEFDAIDQEKLDSLNSPIDYSPIFEFIAA